MSKYILPTVFILIISICGLLFFQWNGVSDSSFSSGKKAEQNVAVRHIDNHFHIKQSIKHVPEDSYEIRKPKNLESFSCESSRHQSCVWLNHEKTKIAVGEGEAITFTYRLPSPENPGHFVLNNWLFEVKNISDHFIRVQLTEEKWRKGEWLAAADSLGRKNMDAIDYYVFEVHHKSPALYWNTKKMNEVYRDQNITVYSDKRVSADYSKLKDLKRNGKLAAIITKHEEKIRHYDDLILVPEQNEESVLAAILKNTISIEEQQEWLLDVIISAFLERPFGSEKAQKIYAELERELQNEGVKRWLSNVLSDKTVISARRLDEHVRKSAGTKTNFFTVNVQEKKTFVPYYVLDERPVLLNGMRMDAVTILYHDDQSYISFIPVAEHLGFKVQPGKNDVIIQRGDGTFQFLYGKKIFYKNGRPFGLSSDPFLLAGDEPYVHTELLFPIFGVTLNEADNQVNLE